MTTISAFERLLDKPIVERRLGPQDELPKRRRTPRRWATWLPYLLVAVVSAIVAFTNVANAPAFQDDEGTYTFQAMAIWDGRLAPYSYWYDHPPFGWMQLAAFGWIPRLLGVGGSAIGSMRHVVAAYLVVNAVLVYALARRLRCRPVFAAVAVAFFVFSPLSVELGRQVFLDNIAMPWILAAFLLVMDKKHNLAAHIGAGICFSMGVLSKETMAIYGPALLFLLWQNSHKRTRSFSILGFLTIGGLALSAYPLMALLKGELLPREDRSTLWDALMFQFVERQGSGYIWESGSSKSHLISGWMFFDEYLLWGGIICAVLLVTRRQTRWLAMAILSFFLPVIASKGYLPAMYVVAVLPFLALAIGAQADVVWTWASRGDNYKEYLRRVVARVGVSTAGDVALIRRRNVKINMILFGRRAIQGGVAIVMVAAFWFASMPSWEQHNSNTLSKDKNKDWVATVDWVKANLARDEVVAVPPSMWQDLRDAGWPDEWSVISVEKVDLDPKSFNAAHSTGWRAIDYVIVNSTVTANIGYLGLHELQNAVNHGVVVAGFGGNSVLKIER